MKKNGFTIIELMISVFILSVAVVGIFSSYSMISILTSNSSDRIVASYLAQEGAEIVRNIRDINWLDIDNGVSGATWIGELSSCYNGCEADYTTTGSGSNPLRIWTTDSEGRSGNYLNIDSNGFYKYDTNNTLPTKFKRKIIVTALPGSVEEKYIMKVSVQVSWNEKATLLFAGTAADVCGANNCITVDSTLYDWY